MLLILLMTLLLAIPLNSPILNTAMLTRLTGLVFLTSLLISFNAFLPLLVGTGLSIFSGQFEITAVSVGIEVLTFFLSGLICFALPLRTISLPCELPLIFVFTALGGVLLLSSSNLISLFLSLELQSFAVYILGTLSKSSNIKNTGESSTFAGLMYFLLGALASCLVLLGSGLIYTATGCLDFSDLQRFGEANLGFMILLIGLLFKIAAAPLHNWSILVYDQIPTHIVTWLAVLPKVSILGIIVHFNGLYENKLIFVSALLSIAIGSVLGLTQNRIKRLLAYSSISHIGFLLLSLAVGTVTSLMAFILYLIQYSMTSLALFLLLLGLSVSSDIVRISELRGLYRRNPLLCVSLSICFFSMAGLPFLIGFFAKLETLNVCLQSGYTTMALIAILMSVVSAGYYLKVIQITFDQKVEVRPGNETILTNSGLSYAIALLTLMLLTFIINPSLWLNPIHLIVLNST